MFGGSGFLGSHVTDALIDAGFQVTVFDKFRSSHLNASANFIAGDITDFSQVKEAVGGHQYVYNFAGIADIDDATHRPLETVSINIQGNANILEASRLSNVKRFVLASTVYVFSKSGSFYRVSKQACENYVEAYQDQYKLPYTILRYGSLYGRRSGNTNGIYRLLRQALEQKKIHYSGSAESMREYIHVTDAARLSVKILDPEFENRHIIITGHERMPVRSLIRMVCEMLPESVAVTYAENPAALHYLMTPYSFTPTLGHKLVATDHVDIGQGLLDCLSEIYEQLQSKPIHPSLDVTWSIPQINEVEPSSPFPT